MPTRKLIATLLKPLIALTASRQSISRWRERRFARHQVQLTKCGWRGHNPHNGDPRRAAGALGVDRNLAARLRLAEQGGGANVLFQAKLEGSRRDLTKEDLMRSMLKGRRPSPAMVLAVIALVVALAGTSMASIATISKLSGKTVKKNSLPGNRVKKNTITGKQVKEASLGEVPKAQNAVSANNATTANGPVGWARVSSTGVVLASRNVTQGNVSPGSADYWCFSGLGFSFRGLQVTVDYWNGTQFFDTIAQASVPGVGNSNLGGTGCAANTQAFVTGKRGSNGATSPIGFFVAFYN